MDSHFKRLDLAMPSDDDDECSQFHTLLHKFMNNRNATDCDKLARFLHLVIDYHIGTLTLSQLSFGAIDDDQSADQFQKFDIVRQKFDSFEKWNKSLVQGKTLSDAEKIVCRVMEISYSAYYFFLLL